MDRIACRAESSIDYKRRILQSITGECVDITTAISHATCTVAEDVCAKAVIVVTISGFTARQISHYRPTCPIVACSIRESTAAQMNLLFDVQPLLIPLEDKEELLFSAAISAAKKAGYVEKGDKVVLSAGVPLGCSGNTNMIRVMEVE